MSDHYSWLNVECMNVRSLLLAISGMYGCHIITLSRSGMYECQIITLARSGMYGCQIITVG